MSQAMHDLILDKIARTGWTGVRGVAQLHGGEAAQSEIKEIEAVMKDLQRQGKVSVWKLTLHADGSQMMAAAKPGFDLGKELETRQAWADAAPWEEE